MQGGSKKPCISVKAFQGLLVNKVRNLVSVY